MLFGESDPESAARRISEGNFADLVRVTPEDGSIRVDAVREMTERISLKPFASDRIFVIIEESDLMNAQAQNKLLKTLEEPAGNNVIMLLAANTESLRATIRSRCMKINLGAETANVDRSVRDDGMKVLSTALFGKPTHEAFAVLDGYLDDPFSLLDVMELFLRDIVVGGYDSGLVADEDNREIARKMNSRRGVRLTAGIAVIEDTRVALRFGRVNRKNGLRDMVIRLRES
jgi:hypothetical protein